MATTRATASQTAATGLTQEQFFGAMQTAVERVQNEMTDTQWKQVTVMICKLLVKYTKEALGAKK